MNRPQKRNEALKSPLEIKDSQKLAFLAGMNLGIKLFRGGFPLNVLGDVEVCGEYAFESSFTRKVVDSAAVNQALQFFDALHRMVYGE